MWLLSTDRGELKCFHGPDDFQLLKDGGYAILSHTWGENEQKFQDIQALCTQKPALSDNTPRDLASDKIWNCCMLAESHGYRWVWIDTCCIDQTSSSELSEAINSMFDWYRKAAVCYAYLSDVSSHDLGPKTEFYASRWFTRGWTLQELIAPTSVLFVLNDWSILGTRTDLVGHVDKITNVGKDVLLHRCELGTVSIAQRMSWAARRETTRVEDEAYCLMGIFGVNMPTIYGEGRSAFYRLQEEIMKISTDQTIFAWGPRARLALLLTEGEDLIQAISFGDDWHDHCLLAPSPREFERSGDLEPVSVANALEMARFSLSSVGLSSSLLQLQWKSTSSSSHDDKPPNDAWAYGFTVTPQGMRSTLPMIRLSIGDRHLNLCIAVLACTSTRTQGAVTGLLLYPLSDLLETPGYQRTYASNWPDGYSNKTYRLVTLNAQDAIRDRGFGRPLQYNSLPVLPSTQQQLRADMIWESIDILHRPLPHMWNNFSSTNTSPPHGFHTFLFSKWSVMELQQWGFRPTNDLSLLPSDSGTFFVTFVSSTVPTYEAFNILLVGYNLKKECTVTIDYLPEGSPVAIQRRRCVQIEPEQNWSQKFGDTDREIKLVFNRCRRPIGYYYLVDIKLSGKIYTKLRDEMTQHAQFTRNDRKRRLKV